MLRLLRETAKMTTDLWISTDHPAVYKAIKNLPKSDERIDIRFEEAYNCKIHTDPEDVFKLTGRIVFTEEKHHTWFMLKFS